MKSVNKFFIYKKKNNWENWLQILFQIKLLNNF